MATLPVLVSATYLTISSKNAAVRRARSAGSIFWLKTRMSGGLSSMAQGGYPTVPPLSTERVGRQGGRRRQHSRPLAPDRPGSALPAQPELFPPPCSWCGRTGVAGGSFEELLPFLSGTTVSVA